MDYQNDELNRRREERGRKRARHAARMKWLKWGAIATAAILVLCGVAILIAFLVARQPAGETPQLDGSTDATTSTTLPEETQPVTPDTVIHFVAGGDLNVTDKVVAAGAVGGIYDYSNVFLDVMPLIAGADLSAVNFEGNVYGVEYGGSKYTAPQQLLQALQSAGVDLVQMANSRTIANGLLGLQSTLSGIQSAGMDPVGAYADSQAYDKTGGYIIRDIQGIRVAIVAFTKGMDGMGLPAGSENCVNLLYKDYSSTYQKVDTDGINAVLKRIRAQKPDVTIALLHWGSEFNDQISSTQEQICQLMQKGGVDAIIGTHPHYVQKVEYNASAGTVVAYSLGDFLGNADKAGTNYSILLDLEITKDGKTGKVKITAANHVPLFILDETESGGGMQVLRMREAITAYENNYVDKVSEEVYEAMVYALSRIEARVKGE